MKFAYLLLLFLFIGASALALFWSNRASDKERQLSSFTGSCTTLQNAFHEMINYSIAGTRLNNRNVSDIDHDSIRISTLFPLDEKKLVFRFKENQCLDCIDSTLAVLNEFARIAGNDKVVILTTWHDLSRLRALRRVKNIPFKIYNCEQDIFQRPGDDLPSPYLFVMDHQLTTELPLRIESTGTWLSRYYLSEIKTALVKNYNLKYPITMEKTASIRFLKTEEGLGNIRYAGKAVARFGFYNNGTNPLVITSVVTSCGCTTASYPRQPVLSGDSSYIEVGYDTRRTGEFDRTISVYSNALQSPTNIRIKGYIEKENH